MALGHKALQGANGDGRVKLASSAGWFARMTADAAADRSKRIRDPGIAIRLLVPPLGDEGDVAAGLGMDGTGLHAGKVGLEPLEVHQFGSGLQGALRDLCHRYFLTVSSTLAVAPLTSTACVVGFPSSLQVFRDRKSTRLNSSHQIISYAV